MRDSGTRSCRRWDLGSRGWATHVGDWTYTYQFGLILSFAVNQKLICIIAQLPHWDENNLEYNRRMERLTASFSFQSRHHAEPE